MATRITFSDLVISFMALADTMRRHGVDTTGWHLSRWSPGDGWSRYRIEANGGSTMPLGHTYRTRAEMYAAMQLARYAVSLIGEDSANG